MIFAKHLIENEMAILDGLPRRWRELCHEFGYQAQFYYTMYSRGADLDKVRELLRQEIRNQHLIDHPEFATVALKPSPVVEAPAGGIEPPAGGGTPSRLRKKETPSG